MKQRVLPFLLVLSWLALIFSFSAQDAATSSHLSGGIVGGLVGIIEILEPDFSLRFDVTRLHGFIRNAAHFSLYFVLGVYVANLMRTFFSDWFRVGVDASLFALVVGIFDEMYQYTVPGRAMSMGDILIDFAGAIAGVGLYILFVYKLIKPVTFG